jgi:hypothetical protein
MERAMGIESTPEVWDRARRVFPLLHRKGQTEWDTSVVWFGAHHHQMSKPIKAT